MENIENVTPEEEAVADTAFEQQYHCTRAELREAIAAMRRVPTDENPNPNYQVDNYRDLQVVKDENGNILFSEAQIQLITDLCQKGLLSLYKTHEMFYLGSEDIARYWVYPVADDASVVINGETYTLHDCDEPKWVRVESEYSEYGVNIAPGDFKANETDPQHLQLPTVRVVQPTADDTKIEIPIQDILTGTRLYPTLHSGNTKLTIDLANPIHEVLEFVEIAYDRIEVAPAPDSWEVGEKYLMRMSFYDEKGYAYIGGNEDNCRVGYIYFYILIVPNTVQWTGAVSTEWGNDENWIGVKEDGTLMEIGYAPLEETNVIIPELPDDKPYPSIGSTDLYPKDIHYTHNQCQDIYFAVGAQLHNQHLLQYRRAFVDMQIQAAQWNAMAPPLKGMYTGDMYVPHTGKYNNDPAQTGKSVEYTSLTGTNGHSDYPFVVREFTGARTQTAPYVFWQALYNKRVSNQHENGNSSSPALTNESLFLQTNSLNQKLEPGTGYQVLGYGPTHGTADEIVIRLPKPDDTYYYYYSNGAQSQQSVSVTHSSQLAFEPTDGVMRIELKNDLASNQFMFGNPTMAYIDMAAFLEANNDVLAPKYYSIQNSAWNAQNMYSIAADGGGLLAPMRSVMLELAGNSDRKSITVKLSSEHLVTRTPIMAIELPSRPSPQRVSANLAEQPQSMTIYATSSAGQAKCMLIASPNAIDAYDSHEDVLFTSTGVETSNIVTTPVNMYTVSEQVPMMIDVREHIDTVPLSMLVHDSYRTTQVEFAFYLTKNWDKECYFVDKMTGTRTRILDGTILTVQMPQDHEQRYYIEGPDQYIGSGEGGVTTSTSSIKNPSDATLRAYSLSLGEVTVSASELMHEVKLYDMAGRLIGYQMFDMLQHTTTLSAPAGIYVVEATLRDGTTLHTQAIVR